MPKPLDIVLPCYNPLEGWYKELLSFYSEAGTKADFHFVLVNDGSTNGEFEKALPILSEHNIPFRVISYINNRGKGHALRSGVETCKSGYILYTDVDFPFINSSVIKMIDLIHSDQYDVLAGLRDASYYRHSMSGFRKLLSKSFRFFLRFFLHMKITDTQCGLKAFNEKGKQEFLKTRINRYLFDFEFIYRSGKVKGMRILPVPVELKSNVTFSKMKPRVLLQEMSNLISVILFRKS